MRWVAVVVAGLGVEGTEYFLVVGDLEDGVELEVVEYLVDVLAGYSSVVISG